MKSSFISIVPIITFSGLFLFMISNDKSPELKLIGKWEEVSWEYEKVDKPEKNREGWIEEIDDQVQKEMYSHLFIHEAELWNFLTNKNLLLFKNENKHDSLRWKLKGRGNVLELQHNNLETEQYIIHDLTPDELVLHFNSDLQVRGIVKMIFKRID
ncbi:hypothetical protein [Reichenbachiella sp. MALMAid0571]|uniref:hypothetical protein n=1 Tax=Reichenbachiella sp. MALMAid0571 TaxID=3143939 RepID=UPI0032DE4E1A